MSTLRNRLLFVFIFLFLALRLTTLLTAVEEVSWYEELFTGVLPKEWMHNWKLPIWEYQASEYHSGSLVVGALATPFFLLFGPNLFALKLVPLLFSLGTMVLLYIFLVRFFSLKVAAWATLLYIFCPPSFTKLSFFAMGFHPESNIFSAAMLLSLYQFLYGKRYRRLSLALFGLSAGLGAWFSYTTLIALAACLITWVLVDFRSFFSRTLLLFALCFLIGFLPWIFFNLTYHFVGLDIFRYRLAGLLETLGDAQKLLLALLTFKTLVSDSVPKSFSFPEFLSIPGQIWSYLYYFIVLSLVVPFFIRARKITFCFFQKLPPSRRETLKTDLHKLRAFPFFLYPVLFLLAYVCVNGAPPTKFHEAANNFRYFSVLYFFGFPLVAIAGCNRKHTSLFLVPLLVLGLVGQGSLFFKEPFGRALKYKGYSYGQLALQWIKMKYPLPEGLDELFEAVQRFSGPERDYLYRSFTWKRMWVEFNEEPDIEVHLRMIAKVPAPSRRFFWETFGMRYGRGIAKGKSESSDLIHPFVGSLSSEEQKYFYRGITQGFVANSPFWALRYLDSSPPWLPIEEKPTFYFQLGVSIGVLFSRLPEWWQTGVVDLVERSHTMEKNWIYRGIGSAVDPGWDYRAGRLKSLRFPLEKLPVERKRDFFWGVGWQLRKWAFEDRIRALDRVKWLPKEFQPYALEGIEYYETSLGQGAFL